MEQTGSEKKYSFCIPPESETKRVAVYEACIDALAHMTLEEGKRDKSVSYTHLTETMWHWMYQKMWLHIIFPKEQVLQMEKSRFMVEDVYKRQMEYSL